MLTNKEIFSKMSNKEYSGHKKKVYTLCWSLHGSKLASGSADNNIRVINLINIIWNRFGIMKVLALIKDMN